MHGFDLICHIGLCSAEQQAVFHVALYGGDQLVCNAVRDLAGGTFGKAAVAGTVRDLSPAMTCCMKGFIMARPGIPTGLFTMAMSSFAAWIRILSAGCLRHILPLG